MQTSQGAEARGADGKRLAAALKEVEQCKAALKAAREDVLSAELAAMAAKLGALGHENRRLRRERQELAQGFLKSMQLVKALQGKE